MLDQGSDYQESGSFVDLLGSPVIFLHDINTLPNFTKIVFQVDGIEKYERTLAIARSEDVVITKYQPERSYLEWLRKTGLGSNKLLVLDGTKTDTLPERVIKNHARERLRSTLGRDSYKAVISPYYGGPQEYQASKYLGYEMYADPGLVMRYDSKIVFKKLCQKIGVPVLDVCVCSVTPSMKSMTDAVNRFIDETGRVIIRGEFGASASTTYVLDKVDYDIIREIAYCSKPGDRYLVEPFYDTLSQPSSVWFISHARKIVHLRTSNQILDEETSHIGNEFPVEFDEKRVQEFSFLIARCLCLEGFIGPFGIDFLETKDGIFAAECNPRVTGAMYPWELVSRFEERSSINAARAQNIHLPRKGLRFKNLLKIWGDVIYDGQNGDSMIFPFNVGPVSEGKVTLLGTGASKSSVKGLFEYINTTLQKLLIPD
ncbi:MAG: ATP-grasp domain-containing protein [Candidatus Heimdallarchaeota archaeon]